MYVAILSIIAHFVMACLSIKAAYLPHFIDVAKKPLYPNPQDVRQS